MYCIRLDTGQRSLYLHVYGSTWMRNTKQCVVLVSSGLQMPPLRMPLVSSITRVLINLWRSLDLSRVRFLATRRQIGSACCVEPQEGSCGVAWRISSRIEDCKDNWSTDFQRRDRRRNFSLPSSNMKVQ